MSEVRKLVKVKPLEWKRKSSQLSAFQWAGSYRVYNLGPRWVLTRSDGATGNAQSFLNEEAAKAAAQADYEARIYAALTPSPSAHVAGLREADVTRLVETAQWARNRLEAIADEAWHGDARDFKRALIGVFADFDEALARCGSALPAILARADELEAGHE